MAAWHRLLARINAALGRHPQDTDVEAELAGHLAELTDQYQREGMSADEARLEARRRFGGVAQLKEACRDERGFPALEDAVGDLRAAARSLSGSPGLVVAISGVLALGIAASTVTFSWTRAVLSTTRPIVDMDRLTGVWLHNREQGETKTLAAPADLAAWRERQTAFDQIGAQRDLSVNLSGADTPVRVGAAAVTSQYFTVFSARPVVGRAFTAADEVKGANAVVVLGYRLWTRQFGGDRSVLGRIVRIDDVPTEVVGVLPRNDYSPDLLIPLQLDSASADYGNRSLFVTARLKDGITLEQARASMLNVGAELERAYPDRYQGWSINTTPLQEEFVGRQARLAFGLLFAFALSILAIGCLNSANLMLARGLSRARESATRIALGASLGRLLRGSFAEGLLLAGCACLAGLLLSVGGLRLVRATFDAGAPYMDRAALDGYALAFAILAATGSTLLFAVLPAWYAIRQTPATGLRDATARVTMSRGTSRLRQALVVGEVAIAALLILVAVLVNRTLTALYEIPLGFKPDRVLTMRVSVPPVRHGTAASLSSFYDESVARLEAMPGAVRAGATTRVPAAGSRFNPNRSLEIEGRTAGPNETRFAVDLAVTPGYLETLQVPLRSGAFFERSNVNASQLVALVSETAAARYWAGSSPAGARIRLGDEPPGTWRTVIGVVGDVRNDDIDAPPMPYVYVPLAQRPARDVTFVVRTAGDPLASAVAARTAITSVDPDQPVYDVRTLEQVLGSDLQQTAVLVGLAAILGGLALILSASGIYAVVSYWVVQARRDIGIRLALGATRTAILTHVVLRGLVPVGIGMIVGGLAGGALLQGIRSALYGVSIGDPANYLLAGTPLLLMGIIACALPAWRAAALDPLDTLRAD